jgi:basic membrane protein A
MKRSIWKYLALLLVVVFVVSACGPAATEEPAEAESPAAEEAAEEEVSEETESEDLKVCFVNNTTINDQGWSFSHNQGRLYLEENVEGVTTSYVDEVYDTGGVDAAKVYQDLVTQGCEVIFGTSFGYNDAVVQVAEKNPDVLFLNYDQFKLAENVASYRLNADEGLYLTGIMAGLATEDDLIGVVGTFPIPQLVREINGFAMGVKSVNPDATVKVVWLNSWYDPARAKEAAEGLINAGADVIQQFTTSAAAVQAAEEAEVLALGYQVDQSEFAPDYLLTSMLYHWGPVYADLVQMIQNGNWESGEYWYGLADEAVGLGKYGPEVTSEMETAVADAKEGIVSGELEVFEGPISDQDGEIRVAEGETLSLEEQLAMDWFIENVEGTVSESE